MKLGKIFKVFKKGAKAAGGRKKKKGASAFKWPSGVRLGVFGHANSGKTVYFSILYEESKIARDLQISVTDNATASEFLRHYRSIWGLSTAVDSGTAIDLVGEKKFPDPTERDLPLIFNATLDRSKRVGVVSYDYNGKAVAISASGDDKEKVMDFMTGCDGLLFFFDPKVLKAEVRSQAHAAAFVNLIEAIAPLGSRLPIPVALVITKADVLPGFTGEDQTILVPPESESLLAEDFDLLMERMLSSSRISGNPTWAASVREVFLRLRPFLRAVLGRTLDFQIFFTSATGQTPEKIGADIGRSIYAPPRKITPIGVKEPFYWLLKAVLRNRRISRLRRVTRWVAALAAIWVVCYSLPYLYHFQYLLARTQTVERNTMKPYDGNIINTSSEERGKIIRAYRNYESSWVVKNLFPAFVSPAGRVRNVYDDFDAADAVKRLDRRINDLAVLVADTSRWPTVNLNDSSLNLEADYEKVLADLESFHKGNETSELYRRSDRVLNHWSLFAKALIDRSDTALWNTVKRQVDQDQARFAKEISSAEKSLDDALRQHEIKQVEQVIAQSTAFEFSDEIVNNINNNSDPKYRLEGAVRDLEKIRRKLSRSDSEHLNMIDRYIRQVRQWDREREYTCKFETVPEKTPLYFEITETGENAAWNNKTMYFRGDEVTFKWKPGQDIHVALDTSGHAYNWGKNACDQDVKSGKYALFELEKGLSFKNVGIEVTVRFTPPLTERLPVLE